MKKQGGQGGNNEMGKQPWGVGMQSVMKLQNGGMGMQNRGMECSRVG
jgi:hypothetical protein